uniref:DUF668 domain-containing protein n=1 Tax=Kalanchoe fedtschenkoi TaxID=63787 RepID=A0A7N0UUM9_KALFE
MVAALWILKMGNQVSQNLKLALSADHSSSKKCITPKKPDLQPKEVIGILSFEVANVISKTIYLHNSLTDQEMNKLKNDIFKSEAVRKLVSNDESYLMELALAEKLEEFDRVTSVVSRLGKKCKEPALQGFEHVYGDLLNGNIDVKGLGFLVKDMDGMVRKMERYVQATTNLYFELEALNEMEQTAKKFHVTQNEETRRAFEQKLNWHRQDVSRLQDVSLWNQTYDKVVELLVRTVCTIFARICIVFGDPGHFDGMSSVRRFDSWHEFDRSDVQNHSQMISGPLIRLPSKTSSLNSGQFNKGSVDLKGRIDKRQLYSQRGEATLFHNHELIFPCGTSPSRLFMDCLSLTSSASKLEDDDYTYYDDQNSQMSSCCSAVASGLKRQTPNHPVNFNGSQFGTPFSEYQRHFKQGLVSYNSQLRSKSKLKVYAEPRTIGGSALALHYANVIIILEKLLRYPHLVGEEARDDLYQMLPTSLRRLLKTNLKSYFKHIAIFDAPLAHDWKETLDGILKWLAPLAHNMIRWQSERNIEQHQIGTRTNVLLLQTLYFADRQKTEAVICEILVGLNYICRYEQQQNALLDCASSFDFDDCKAWHMQQ